MSNAAGAAMGQLGQMPYFTERISRNVLLCLNNAEAC